LHKKTTKIQQKNNKKQMKIQKLIFLVALLNLFSLFSCNSSHEEDKNTENQISKDELFGEVQIGNQIWMRENLNIDHFCNGDPIPQAKTLEEWKRAGENRHPVWCYYENDTANGVKYGKLYNWYAVNDIRLLAPRDWHIPSKNEWIDLFRFLGDKDEIGGKMKTKEGWTDNSNGNNSSGFSGLPGGGYFKGTFEYIGKTGCWWSATEYNRTSDFAWAFKLGHNPFYSIFDGNNYRFWSEENFKNFGFSVRCVKD
jgi:uncharacterized protein (TIGR02145 family)